MHQSAQSWRYEDRLEYNVEGKHEVILWTDRYVPPSGSTEEAKNGGDPPRSFRKLKSKSAVLCTVSTFSVPPSHASVLIRFLVPTPPFLAWIRHSGRWVSRCFGAEDLAPFAADSGAKFSFQFCPSLALKCY